jgi:pseudouridine synthase
MTARLQKILSQWGIASRRQAEQLIQDGRVRLNGEVAKLGQTAEPTTDRIEVDGRLITSQSRPDLVYLLLNKPIGVISTCHDPQGRRTVLELLPPELRQYEGIHPVGRLDIDSSGALLLTNDGDLTFSLTHPSHNISKTYEVWVRGRPSNGTIDAWQQGINLDGQYTLPARVKVVKHTDDNTLLRIILTEGRNRQIRRVATQLCHPVVRLHRTGIGNISVDGELALALGTYRHLQSAEVRNLRARRQSEFHQSI